MIMVCDFDRIEDYLLELNEVNYSNPMIEEKIEELFNSTQTESILELDRGILIKIMVRLIQEGLTLSLWKLFVLAAVMWNNKG